MRLLLISNSTNYGGKYLDYSGEFIKTFLGNIPGKILFIPYAAVTFSYDEYEKKVSGRFMELGLEITSIHHFDDPVAAIAMASAIVVGGGNSWKLLKIIRENNLIEFVREKVISGTPYIGWSAGANVACPTIMTTNDMPVVEPDSFKSFNLIPFQINPHFTDKILQDHSGETREQRIEEFTEANPGIIVAGLREGTMLLRENDRLALAGQGNVRIFKKGEIPAEYTSSDDLSFLLRV